MPGFPFPSRPGRELGEPLLDALLDRQSLPPDDARQVRTVAELLADLAGPAEPGELAGETAARSAFTHYPSPADASPAARRSGRRHPWTPRGAKLAAALIAAAVGLSGATAYAGVLPGPVQDFAHHMIGAPPAHRAHPLKPQPGKVQPSRMQPSTIQPGGGKPGKVQPSKVQPSKVQPGGGKPGKAQPSKAQPSKAQPGAGKPGKVQSSKAQPGVGKPGKVQPGTIQPGKVQPGTIQPGTIQPGKIQPGGGKPGKVQPSKVKPGNSKVSG
jgi:hypothetical protein